MPIATAANVAQGAAALALALKTRSKKTKAIALPASLSAFLGITEPAIFGVNIRYMKPFIAGCIGGACGGLAAGLFGVGATAYGITGVFGFLITTNYTLQYALVILVASAVAFIISWMLYKEPKEQTAAFKKNTVYSPMQGTAVPLTEVPDDTFAAEILGKGMAVVPEDKEVISPVNGTVSTVFDTKHAVGITADDGMEILIHVGINTVELNGQYFTAHVKEGDLVKAGQPLLTADLKNIADAGYNLTTPVIITNSDDYEEVLMTVSGKVNFLDQILEVK